MKDSFMAYAKLYSTICLEEMRNTTKIYGQDSRSVGRPRFKPGTFIIKSRISNCSASKLGNWVVAL